jgi:integrase
MAIRPVEFTREHKKCRFDQKTKTWKGFEVDVYVLERRGGKLKRKRIIYPTKGEAEKAETRLKTRTQNIRLGIYEKSDDGEETKIISLKQLFDRHLETIRERKKKELSKRVTEYFMNLPDIGASFPVSELTTADLKRYELARSKETVKGARNSFVQPQTIDRELTVLSAALKKAAEYFSELEDWTPPRIPRPTFQEARRERVISENEEKQILAHFYRERQKNESDEQYRARVAIGHQFEFAILTSSRRKEVVRLKWTDYFPEQDLLRITRWKTVKSKTDSVTNFSPLPERVKELLKIRRELANGSEYIFSRDGRDSEGYQKALELACQKLGIPYGRFTDGSIIFHDTRHTFVSRLLKAGIDLETVRELSGLSRDMILRYAHSSAEQKRRAVEVLNGSGSGATGAGSNAKHNVKNLREIYDKILSGEMSFEEFEALLSEAKFRQAGAG